MKVRFILDEDDARRFDKTVDLPAVPEVGETVGIDPGPDSMFAGSDRAWLVEVSERRWFVNGDDEPTVIVYLGNQYQHSGCRYGFGKMMAANAAESRRKAGGDDG